jgi:hypothetical protein
MGGKASKDFAARSLAPGSGKNLAIFSPGSSRFPSRPNKKIRKIFSIIQNPWGQNSAGRFRDQGIE